MISLPRIEIFELFDDKPSEKREDLFSPDQVYSLLTGISRSEDWLDEYDEPVEGVAEGRSGEYVNTIYDRIAGAGRRSSGLIDAYCEGASQCAILADRPSWKAKGSDFSGSARAYLSVVFLKGLEPETAGYHSVILRAIARDLETEGSKMPLKMVVLAILLFPLYLYQKFTTPRCLKGKLTPEARKEARRQVERLYQYCESSVKENRRFSFIPPDDRVEQELDLGDLKIQVGKDGVRFG